MNEFTFKENPEKYSPEKVKESLLEFVTKVLK
jgi:hypothetical protein